MELSKNNDDSTPRGFNDVMLSKNTLSPHRLQFFKISKLTAHLPRKATFHTPQGRIGTCGSRTERPIYASPVTVPRFKEEATTKSTSVLSLCHPRSSVVLSKQVLWGRTTMLITQEAGLTTPVLKSPQLALAWHYGMGPHGDSCIGAGYRSNQGAKTYPRASSRPSRGARCLCSWKMLHPPQPLMSPNPSCNYQTQETSSNEGLHFTHLCTPSSQSNPWDMGDFQSLLNKWWLGWWIG